MEPTINTSSEDQAHSNSAFNEWWNFIEAFLAFDCIMMALFNLWVLCRRKVYKSWSSTSVLLSCTVLLITRTFFLLFFAIEDDITDAENFLMVSSLLEDVPTFLVMNITLALAWQWWRLTQVIVKSDEAFEDIKEGRSDKRLILTQLCFLGMVATDFAILVCHYQEGFLTATQETYI